MATSIEIKSPQTGAEAPAPQPEQTERPEWLPEQFKTVDDFVKSYQDQRAEITRLQQGAAKGKQDTPPPTNPSDAPKQPDGSDAPKKEEGPKDIDDAAQKVIQASGVDITSYQDEYDRTGDLSVEARDALAKKFETVLGKDARQIIDDYVEAKKVVHKNARSAYYDAAGGEENFNAMAQWASENLPEEEVARYQRAFNTRDPHTTILAIENLRAKYEAAEGRPASLFKGRANSASGEGPFRSSAEMTKAMSDPRYRTDPAYRDSIARRVALSNF